MTASSDSLLNYKTVTSTPSREGFCKNINNHGFALLYLFYLVSRFTGIQISLFQFVIFNVCVKQENHAGNIGGKMETNEILFCSPLHLCFPFDPIHLPPLCLCFFLFASDTDHLTFTGCVPFNFKIFFYFTLWMSRALCLHLPHTPSRMSLCPPPLPPSLHHPAWRPQLSSALSFPSSPCWASQETYTLWASS